ncbi:MAG: hypothetical protein MK212_01885 [Saprospiraceae bacterium]|nr:hypothetical protein [Saprospiraceae bacterium]
MKNKPVQVRKEIPEFTSMDYNALKEEGIDLVQTLSGDIWTDYNPHDPGVTILEQLCFALTDLGYRTNFKIQDLLNARSRKRRQELNNTFFDALDALPSNPVSLDDYRILLIDRIQYVRNAWVYPVDDHLQGIKGLYRVLLEVEDTIREDERKIAEIKQEVITLFNDYRNLSEDIERIEILGIERIVIDIDIDIASDAVGEEILAEILFRIEEYLNPSIQFHTLEELQEEGYTVDQIFDGPKPEHGFIKKADLRPVRREVYISKLIEIITGVEGVRRIEYFEVKKDDIPVEGDVILIADKKYPILDMDPINFLPKPGKKIKYPIRFYRGALRYDLDLNTTNQLYSSLFASYRKGYSPKMLYRERDYPSVLKAEEISHYYSIQNTFPVTYGVNRFGLPNNVRPTRERKAMVKQLRGYLSFFEQIIANYLAQLSNIKKLFSIDESVQKTYFCQIPLDAPGLGEIMKTRNYEPEKQAKEFLGKLEKLVAKFDPYADRRNRFLDHLLARFGEQFVTDFLLRGDADGDPDTGPEEELINAKIKYLRNWVVLSKNRGRGFNYMKNTLDEWNVSGLEKRICLLLNIAQSGNESLMRAFSGDVREEKMPKLEEIMTIIPSDTPEGILDLSKIEDQKKEPKQTDDSTRPEGFTAEDILDGMEEITKEGGEETIETSDEEGKEQELKETYDYTEKFVFRSHTSQTREEGKMDPGLLRDLLSGGILSFNYLVVDTPGRDTHSIYYRSTSKKTYKIREVDTRLEARECIEELIAYLYRINCYCEGMHLIEHILLRPQAKDRYGFRLLDDNFSPLLQNYKYGDQDEQRQNAYKVGSVGTELANYEYQKQKNGAYQIVLKNPDQNNLILAVSPGVFADPETAKAHVEDNIIAYIKSYVDNQIPLNDQIKLYKEKSKTDDVKNSFYSFKTSIVMPDWPIRFQNADFKSLLGEVVSVNIPAHLGADFYWLDVVEMEEFEIAYMEWLDERTKPVPLQPDLDEKAHRIIKILEKFEDKRVK